MERLGPVFSPQFLLIFLSFQKKDPESDELPVDLQKRIESNGIDLRDMEAVKQEIERYAKLQPVNVKGGVILRPIRFSIKG